MPRIEPYQSPRVNAVVMNWNGRQWLELVLPSLLAQTYANLQVIVVDCNSRDGSAAWVRQHFPQVRVHEIPFDCSPPFANNLVAREYDCDWICLLNNDVLLPPECIAKLVDASRSAAPDAVINPVQLDWDGNFYALGFADPAVGKTFASLPFLPRFLSRKYEHPFYPCTACCLVARSTLLRLPLNEDLFIFEDIDWGWRVLAAGGEMEACEDAAFFHAGARTFNSSARQIHVGTRNIAAGLWMSAQPLLLLWLLPWYVAGYGVHCIELLVERRPWRPFWTGLWECLRLHKTWTAHRRNRRAEHRRSSWEMFCRMAASADFQKNARMRWLARWPGAWSRPSLSAPSSPGAMQESREPFRGAASVSDSPHH